MFLKHVGKRFWMNFTSRFAMHLEGNKMYRDLHRQYRWPGMKKDVIKYVAQCLTCQQVKADHERASGLLQPLEVPNWKWDHIMMDLVCGLPRMPGEQDTI